MTCMMCYLWRKSANPVSNIPCHLKVVCKHMYLFVWIFSSLPRNFHTYHMETSPLQVKGCKFWPMLGTYGHWAVRVLNHATSRTVTQATLYTGHLRGPVTLPPVAESLAVELSPVLMTWSVPNGDWTPISCMRGKCSATVPLRWLNICKCS